MARRLGKRQAHDPIQVMIHAQAAAKGGLAFQAYGEELFLTSGAIPREFLQLQAPPKQPLPAKPAPKPKSPPTPGTLVLDLPQMLSGKPARGKKRDEPEWKKGARALRKNRGKKEK